MGLGRDRGLDPASAQIPYAPASVLYWAQLRARRLLCGDANARSRQLTVVIATIGLMV